MRIVAFRILNYKSIQDSGEIYLSPMTILAGKNNAGKTATLEALYKCATYFLIADPGFLAGINHFQVHFRVEFTDEELISLRQFSNHTIQRNEFLFIYRCANGNTNFVQLKEERVSTPYSFYEQFSQAYRHSDIRVLNGEGRLSETHVVMDISRKILSQFVFVNGNRTVQQPMTINTSETKLKPDASNLYSYFHVLRNNNERAFNLIRQRFAQIFPDVETLSTPVFPNNFVQIDVSFRNQNEQIPLHECGSGFTHVLIFLGLVHGETESRIVLFDEPQSFLHPSAEKALYDQLRINNLHTVLFTTHSPILMNYPMNKTIILVSKQEGHTKYQSVNSPTPVLAEVGMKNSDFAFADKVLFVEGPTERDVIPLITEHFGEPQIGYNFVVVTLDKTGDELNGSLRIMRRNADIYNRLFEIISHREIPYVIFIDRDERKRNLIDEAYKGKVILTPRREIENFFLDPTIIQRVIADELMSYDVIDNIPTVEDIQECISDLLNSQLDRDFYPNGCNEPIVDVVGSKILMHVFQNYNCTYSKPRHGVMFVKSYLESNPDQLREIFDTLEGFLTR